MRVYSFVSHFFVSLAWFRRMVPAMAYSTMLPLEETRYWLLVLLLFSIWFLWHFLLLFLLILRTGLLLFLVGIGFLFYFPNIATHKIRILGVCVVCAVGIIVLTINVLISKSAPMTYKQTCTPCILKDEKEVLRINKDIQLPEKANKNHAMKKENPWQKNTRRLAS